MSAKQAKRERQRQRAAGEHCDLDWKRAESKRQAQARQDMIDAELAKRALDPEKYDREEAERKAEARARGRALMGLIGSMGALGSMGSISHAVEAPRQRGRYF
jgi:hypothetical protein